MNCRTQRNLEGKLEKVFTRSGEESELYKNLKELIEKLPADQLKSLGDNYKTYLDSNIIKGVEPEELALGAYNQIHSNNFKDFYGDWLEDPEHSGKLNSQGEPEIVNGSFIHDNLSKPVINARDFNTNNPNIYTTPVEDTSSSSSNYSGFTKEVGLNKKEINPSRQAEIQRKVKLYNQKNSTSYFVRFHSIRPGVDGWAIEDNSSRTTIDKGKLSQEEIETYNNNLQHITQGKKTIKSDEALKRISDSKGWQGELAKAILPYIHNNVDIHILSQKEFEDYSKENKLKFYDGIKPEDVGGLYNTYKNEIIIVDKPRNKIVGDVLEEVIHALTNDFIRTDEIIGKQWKNLFIKTKAEFQKKGLNDYYFTNEDEFLAGVLRSPRFQELLSREKSTSPWYVNAFHEAFSKLKDYLTRKLALSFKERTLLDDVYAQASNLIKEAFKKADQDKEISEYYEDPDSLKSEGINYQFSVLSDEDSKDMKDEIFKISTDLAKDLNKDNTLRTLDELYESSSKRLRKLEHKSYKDIKDLFTSDKINRYEILTDQLEKALEAPEDEIGLNRKRRAVASNLVQTGFLLNLTSNRVKDLISTPENAVENIHTLQYYLYTLQDWEVALKEAKGLIGHIPSANKKIIENLDKINGIYKNIAGNDETGLVQTLKPILIKPGQIFGEWADNEIKSAEKFLNIAKKSGNKESIENQQKRIFDLKQAKDRVDFTNDQKIMDFLKGNMGDTNPISAWVESFRDSPSPIVSGFASFVKRNTDEVGSEVYPIEKQLEREVAPIFKYFGTKSRIDAELLGHQILFDDRRVNNDGEEYFVKSLLYPFKNYKGDEKVFKNKIYDLQEKVKSGEDVDKNKAELINQKKEYAKWRIKHLYNPYVDEFYKKYELWDDEIGQKLKLDTDRIFSDVDSILESHAFFQDDLTEDELNHIDALYREYFYLGNLTNLDGSSKSGEELQKAEKMREIRALNAKYYEPIDNTEQFEKARINASDALLAQYTEDSPEYKDGMAKWADKNTRTVIDPKFYTDRKNLINKINAIINRTSSGALKQSTIGKLYTEMIDQVYALRDEDGQPIGSEITAPKTKVLKGIQEKIEEQRDNFTGLSGLTDEEKDRVSQLYKKRERSGLNNAEEEEYDTLLDKSKELGLHKRERAELVSRFQELRNMQSKIPTDYYTESFNNVSSKYGVSIDERGNIQEGDEFVPILESGKIFALLDQPDFADWFNKNHILVNRYDDKVKTKVPKWERLYQWNRVIPTNPDYITSRPAFKYSYRKVKDEYRTGFNKSTGKVDLQTWKHIDNKGNWLPKSPEDGGTTEYVNTRFHDLKNSTSEKDKQLFKFLEINTKYHLNAQDGIPYQNRLGMDLPKFRKETSARNINALKKPSNLKEATWDRFKSYWTSLKEYNSDQGNYKINGDEVVFDGYENVFADKYGQELNAIPIKGTSPLDNKDVSENTLRSIMKYIYSAKMNKKLIDISPIAHALKRITNDPENAPIDTKKRIKGRPEDSPKKGTNNTGKVIDYIIKREFEGYDKAYELGETGDKIAQIAKQMGAWSFLKLNIPSTLANLNKAILDNWETAGHGYYTSKDLAKSWTLYTSRFFPAWQKDYWNNKLGALSLEGQMADTWEFMQSESIEEGIGERFGKSKFKDFMGMNWLFNMREWSEYYPQSRIWLAYMNSIKVEQSLKDGSKRTLPLYDIYELDKNGVITTKDGIPKEWGLKGSEFIRMKNEVQSSIRATHGSYAHFDKSMADQYTSYTFFTFLKKFFIAQFATRFSGDNIKVSVKGGIRSTPRFNVDRGTQWGFYMSALNGISKIYERKSANWENLSKDEKASLWRVTQELGVVVAAQMIITSLVGIDYNKKKPYDTLKNMNWAELQILYQVMRMQVESSTYVSPDQYGDFIATFMAYSAVQKWEKLLKYIVFQDTYQKKTGKYRAGDKKWPSQFQKATGIQQFTRTFDDEESLVKAYDRNIRPHQ